MATGDILSVSINSDGWTATIKVEGLSTGGSYDFGYGAKYLPADANIVFSLTSQGYTDGVLTTKSRTVYGTMDINTGAQRLPYPNQTSPNETINGSDVDIIIPLSEYIFTADTAVTVSIGAGWYTESSTPNNSCTDLSVTNNSTETYPKPIGNWALPGAKLVTGNFDLEFTAFHHFGVDCVKFDVTDGTNEVNYTVSDMAVSARDDYNAVLVYGQTVNVSTLDDGILTAKAVVYPNIGNASYILDTDDAVNMWPTPLYTNQTYRLDTAGVHGFTVVDPISGNDSTGTVYSTQSAAEAGDAFLTVGAALTAVQTYHNANAGHNDAGGGTILLEEGTSTFSSTNGGTLTEWVTITKTSTASRANVITGASVANGGCPTYVRFYDVTYGAGYYFTMLGTKSQWVDTCTLANTGTLFMYRTPASAVTWCDGIVSRGFVMFSTYQTEFQCIRGNSFDARVPSDGYTVLGNRNVDLGERAGTNNALQNNLLYAFNTLQNTGTTTQVAYALNYDQENAAFIQNLIVRYGSQTEPVFSISADGTTTTTRNILLWHNTIAGARNNIAYNDIATGGPYTQDLWSNRNNIFSNFNNKDDTFNANADATGGWPVGYAVGSTGNFYRTSAGTEWFGEFQGLSMAKGTVATPLEPLYVTDNSADGNDTSGGDYHLQESSDAWDLIIDLLLPYDLEGTARQENGSAGVYEMVTASPVTGGGAAVKIALNKFIIDDEKEKK